MQEASQDRPRRRRSDDDDLSGRLDELTQPEVERVLERAIRIHAERSDAQTFTRRQIDELAAELGLPRTVVEKAMEEELTSAGPVGGDENRPLLGPRRLAARTTVEGSASDVADRVTTWMESEEGLRPVSRVGDGVRWVPDSHWTTGARLALGSEGTKVLRGMRETTHRVTSLSDDRHLVEVEVDTTPIRVAAGWTGVGIGATGIAGGVVAAFGFAEGSDLLQFLAVAGPGAVAGLVGSALVGRIRATSVMQGVRRALDGVAHPELYPRAARRRAKGQAAARRRSGFERLVDEVSDALDRLRD